MAGAPAGAQASGGGPAVRFRLKPDRRLASVVELAADALAGEGVAAIGGRLGLDGTATAAAAAPALPEGHPPTEALQVLIENLQREPF